MYSFNKTGEIFKPLRIGKYSNIGELLYNHKICRVINTDSLFSEDHSLRKHHGSNCYWINPNNQISFRSASVSKEEILEWMEGKGPMVKGKTKEEKEAFWKYAKWESEAPPEYKIIVFDAKYFDIIKSDFKYQNLRNTGLRSSIKKPISLKKYKSDDLRKKQIVLDMYFPFIDEIKSDLYHRDIPSLKREYNSIFYGIRRTLFSLGIGYSGASNTPEDILNLSWISGIIFSMAIYNFLLETQQDLPDFKWISKNMNNSYGG